MGKLVDGEWLQGSIITSDKDGAYDRIPRSFRDCIGKDHEVFLPESDRYHLYVSYACPWAHRTLIMRQLKGLEKHISVNVVHPEMLSEGWTFDKTFLGCTGDTVNSKQLLYEIYQMADSKVSTSVTVPILWDKKTKTIVNNESSEIIRIFNTAFNKLTGNEEDYYPESKRDEIDKLNNRIYENLNNGVYRAGFAKNQTAYNKAVNGLFDILDELEEHLTDKEFLVGDSLTEADIRLIPTLLRFDPVYYIHFKCSKRKISEYENLNRYMLKMYSMDAVKSTTNFKHILQHYYYSHETINPLRIVPQVETLS